MSTMPGAGMRLFAALALILLLAPAAPAQVDKDKIYQPGQLPATDSRVKVAVGGKAPDFTLPAVSGGKVSLADYRGKKNVLISFVPAAWTPVCSQQWPGYNLARDLFDERDTVVIGISTDNIPTLYAWTQAMQGISFPVLSDFWPHGAVADEFGILRSDGTAERAVVLVDKKGIIRYIDVHDINQRPDLGVIVREMDKLGTRTP